MSSYLFSPTFPVSLPAGQEPFLGQVPLYPSGYADPLRHFPAAYGASAAQDKGCPPPLPYYQPAGGAYSRTAACDYGAAGCYPDKEPPCALSCLEGQYPQEQRKAGAAQCKHGYEEGDEAKCPTPVYPWMQRVNSCNKVRVSA
ncbi:hypothetical protein FKM82_030233 [Ascaphus truei]